jgi:hypothetical protein
MRARLDPVVALGDTPCVRCGELIEPGAKWHLDHRDDGRGWLGRLTRDATREQAGRR